MAMGELTTAHAVANAQPKPDFLERMADALDSKVKQATSTVGAGSAAKTAETFGQMADWLDQQTGVEPPKPGESIGFDPMDPINQTVRMLSQGATFGYGDEMAAAGDASLDWLWNLGTGKKWGDFYDKNLAKERQHMENFREDNPVLATGAEIAGALPTAFATGAASIAPALLKGGGLFQGLGRTAGPMVRRAAKEPSFTRRLAQGVAGGGASGAVYGYGQGEDGPTNRVLSSVIPGAFGAGAGAVAPMLGVPARAIAAQIARKKASDASGVPASTVDILQDTLEADVGINNRVTEAVPGSVIADVGPHSQSLLSASAEKAGAAARPAHDFMDRRARDSINKTRDVIDEVLGTGQGKEGLRRQLRENTAAARQEAYDEAYATEIPYRDASGNATPAGRELYTRLLDVPDSAINKANKLIGMEGDPTARIVVEQNEWGQRYFQTPPSVKQIDYITRALKDVADNENAKGKLGGTTALGRGAANLAQELRQKTGALIPAYKEALDIAGDVIGKSQALEIGYNALTNAKTVDKLLEDMIDMPPEAVDFVRQGIRERIGDVIEQAQKAYAPRLTMTGGQTYTKRTDPETLRLVRMFSSTANRDKIRALVGDDEAKRMFAALDEMQDSIELRDTMIDNVRKSAAHRRTDEVARQEGGIMAAVRDMQPVEATRRAGRALVGRGPGANQAETTALDEALVNTLLQEADAGRLNALIEAPRAKDAGANARHMIELLFGRGPLAATPAIQQ